MLREAGVEIDALRERVLDRLGAVPTLRHGVSMDLKARCPDLSAAREAAVGHGAVARGEFRHADVDYHARPAHLRLRLVENRRRELISYVRSDTSDLRRSEYHIAFVEEPLSLHRTLEHALGVRKRVVKTRELLQWENVRIHLDTVEELGTFVELTGVVGPRADEALSRERVLLLRGALGIRDEDLVAGSYADL